MTNGVNSSAEAHHREQHAVDRELEQGRERLVLERPVGRRAQQQEQRDQQRQPALAARGVPVVGRAAAVALDDRDHADRHRHGLERAELLTRRAAPAVIRCHTK